jgi:CheY-like chemotaxis protein
VLPSACVLLIDDDETIRELVSAVLGDEGYSIIAVEDVAAGLEAARRALPRLILLDSPARGHSHDDFVDTYRQTPGPHAPIYLFSAASDALELTEKLHLDGSLAKPFDITALMDLAEQHGCKKLAPSR